MTTTTTGAEAEGAAGVATTMSEPARPRPAPARRPGPLPLAACSLGAFLALLALLATQVRAGRDPALGAPRAETTAPRTVIVRRIVVAPGAAPARSAPAPASAPAPVVTRSS
jgi:hypothetical protein